MVNHNFSSKENFSLNDIAVCIDTLGCAKNQVDSREMSQTLINAGIKVVDDISDCNCLIINTCSFIQAATQESIETFFDYKNSYPSLKIIVAGCMPSRYGEDLYSALKEADSFVPCIKEDNIFAEVINVFKDQLTSDNSIKIPLACHANNQYSPYKNKPFAYVKISDGCSRNCSYCMIPKIRGKYKSSSYEDICSEINLICNYNKNCSSNNVKVKEIVLVAQDCGMWGRDFKDGRDLGWLLDKLACKYNNFYFRVLYIQPDAINDDLLAAFEANENVLSYFDIPFQHCNARILRNMNRKGDRKYLLEKVGNIRDKFPNACLRSTLISGFPGEDDDAFDELCEFIADVELDYCGVFEYSDEEGSQSYKLSNKVDSATSIQRANSLRDIIDAISLSKLESKIGSQQHVLIEGYEDNRYYGRAFFQAPDVDGYVFIANNKQIQIGDIVEVTIIDSEYYDLIGKITDN